MEQSGCILVLITTGSQAEARTIADALVNQRKAACVNIVPRVDSLFRWEGKIEEESESLLLVKTRAELLSEVIHLVKEIHSYEVPEIVALPVIGGNSEYLAWVEDETVTK
jgi:periplasmic divalent cation tolerance protein